MAAERDLRRKKRKDRIDGIIYITMAPGGTERRAEPREISISGTSKSGKYTI